MNLNKIKFIAVLTFLTLSAAAYSEVENPALVAIKETQRIGRQIEQISGNDMAARRFLFESAAAQASSPLVAQYLKGSLAAVDTFLGDNVSARKNSNPNTYDPIRHFPNATAFQWVEAKEQVLHAAQTKRIVMINEMHTESEHRLFMLKLLKGLRGKGYTYLALEGLAEPVNQVTSRGWVSVETGFYAADPTYAEIIRYALLLGFKLVQYDPQTTSDMSQREIVAAENIFNQTFAQDRNARVVVYCGHGHIYKRGTAGAGTEMLASRIWKISGFEPLSVEQIMFTDFGERSHPNYNAIKLTLKTGRDMVLQNKRTKNLWAENKYKWDISVFHPPTKMDVGMRPTWLSADDIRVPIEVSLKQCRKFPCTARAYYWGEPDLAVPADLHEFKTAEDRAMLYLRHGFYTIELQSEPNVKDGTFDLDI